jgi:hypothetical protein
MLTYANVYRRFILCGPTADALAAASLFCTAGVTRTIRLLPAAPYKAQILVKSMELTLAGAIDAGTYADVC